MCWLWRRSFSLLVELLPLRELSDAAVGCAAPTATATA